MGVLTLASADQNHVNFSKAVRVGSSAKLDCGIAVF
jgi:hypothetical protein